MEKKVWKHLAGTAAMAALLATAGCGGGTGGPAPTGVDALTVADKVSVVDAKTEESGAGKLLAKLAGIWSEVPAGSDYAKDQPSVYVHEKAADSFGMVNEILCMMAQTKYNEMVNKGEFKALVNEKMCRGNDDVSNASSSQQGTSSNAPEYMEWTVRSTRADNDSPQIIEAWIHEKAEDGRPPTLIQAKAVITEGSSDANPYGIFTMNFAGYPVIGGVPNLSTPGFKGILTSQREDGKVVLKFAELGDGENTAIALEKTDTAGGGRVSFDNEWEGQGEMLFAYNDTRFHRMDAGGANEICLDRENFEISAWRYGMYDATTGSRVNVNSGFPINTEGDGTGKHGWVGYWGLWVPEGVTIDNGDQVYKQNYNGGTAEAYTVVKVGGKLKKHTKNTAKLSAIKNIPLETNDFATGRMIRVIWNGDMNQLRKTGEAMPNPDGPPVWTVMNETYSTDNLPWGELNFWSQSLGGQVRIPLANCERLETGNTRCDAPTGDTDIVYFVENIVYPGEAVPATLACYDNCPSISEGNVSGSNFGLSTALEYTFDSELVLKKNGIKLEQTAAGQQWGYNSGPLFDAALIADPANSPLACEWKGPMGEDMICGWKAWSVLNEFYTWETGLQNWNQLTLLKDAEGTALRFEQPLRVEYTHAQSNDQKPDYKYNGTKFFLDYNGFGELHGIPGKCIDPGTGDPVACGNQTRWVPEFTIPEGSDASYIDKNGNPKQTKIKPLEMEQRMVKKGDNSSCSALPFGDYTLPTIDEWENPNLGAEPAVTAAPAVIGGVVQ